MKIFLKNICPPFIWKACSKIKSSMSKTKAKSNFIDGLEIGINSLIEGRIDIRKQGGKVSIGRRSHFMGMIATETNFSKVNIGTNVHIGSGTVLDCADSITIEDDVLISYGCVIMDSDNHSIKYSLRKNDTFNWLNNITSDWETIVRKPVKICKGAWIGTHVIITKGVTIGEGSIVGAGSVVTKNVADWTIVAGNPAKFIREIPIHER
jgi:acetyltransferase-like isoleucine patch superfamily enzyme